MAKSYDLDLFLSNTRFYKKVVKDMGQQTESG